MKVCVQLFVTRHCTALACQLLCHASQLFSICIHSQFCRDQLTPPCTDSLPCCTLMTMIRRRAALAIPNNHSPHDLSTVSIAAKRTLRTAIFQSPQCIMKHSSVTHCQLGQRHSPKCVCNTAHHTVHTGKHA